MAGAPEGGRRSTGKERGIGIERACARRARRKESRENLGWELLERVIGSKRHGSQWCTAVGGRYQAAGIEEGEISTALNFVAKWRGVTGAQHQSAIGVGHPVARRINNSTRACTSSSNRRSLSSSSNNNNHNNNNSSSTRLSRVSRRGCTVCKYKVSSALAPRPCLAGLVLVLAPQWRSHPAV